MLFFLAALGTLLVDTVWIRTPSSVPISAGAPEVHSVELEGDQVVVRSSGVSLAYLGLLQTSPWPAGGVREFTFRIPRYPQRAGGRHPGIPAEVAGVFVNGMPIFNQFAAASWQGQNLWHFDPVAGSDDGSLTAAGHPSQSRVHGAAPGLLEALLCETGRHSPIIGFALDGYPVYGPWGFAHADGAGGLRRMQSGYRLRQIRERTAWSDGTVLTPGQYGPPVSADYPLGTFAEDYEFVPGSGDLDRYNGRFAVTPEYPQGTYAYFLASDESGRLAFPYLLAQEYAGAVPSETHPVKLAGTKDGITLGTGALVAGKPASLDFSIAGRHGDPVRVLEYVHEKPMHVMVVSEDLAEFDHIHPELQGNAWQVGYTFRHGGRYRIYAESTTPGEDTRTEFFDVTVEGDRRQPTPLVETVSYRAGTAAIEATLETDGPLVAGRDVELRLRLRKPGTPDAVESLEPYLGAWAHFAIVSEGLGIFLHAHPLADGEAPMPPNCTMHSHGAVSGPPPREVRTVVRFEKPGLYKMWAQFQVAGKVEVAPIVLRVK